MRLFLGLSLYLSKKKMYTGTRGALSGNLIKIGKHLSIPSKFITSLEPPTLLIDFDVYQGEGTLNFG